MCFQWQILQAIQAAHEIIQVEDISWQFKIQIICWHLIVVKVDLPRNVSQHHVLYSIPITDRILEPTDHT